MRMLPATANAMQRNAISTYVSGSVPTAYASMNVAVLLFTGTQPTKAEMNAFLNGATQHSGSNACYQNLTSFLTARNADYVGGIGGLKPNLTLMASNVPITLGAAMNTKLVAANTDTRNSYITKDATPTWFALVAGGSLALNLTTGLPTASYICGFLAVGSVGNENSSAELRIAGGKVYANATTGNDQSKATVINDLVITFK